MKLADKGREWKGKGPAKANLSHVDYLFTEVTVYPKLWRKVKEKLQSLQSEWFAYIYQVSQNLNLGPIFGHIKISPKNPLPHILHLYGLSPVWVRMWTCSPLCWEKRLPQVSHWKGRSPGWVCVKICLWKMGIDFNKISSTNWLLGAPSTNPSPVWVLMWVVRCEELVNFLPQSLHSNGFSPKRGFITIEQLKSKCLA